MFRPLPVSALPPCSALAAAHHPHRLWRRPRRRCRRCRRREREPPATSAADFGGMDALVAAAKKEGKLNVIALPPDWANYGEIIEAFEAKYGSRSTARTRTPPAPTRSTPSSPARARTAPPTCSTSAVAFALSGAAEGLFAPYKVAAFDKIPDGQKDAERPLVQRLRRLRLHRLRRQADQDLPADLRRPAQARVQGQGRAQRQPDQVRLGLRRRVRGRRSPTAAPSTTSSPASTSSRKLKKSGNFIPVESTPATVEKGETPDQHRLGLPQRRLRRRVRGQGRRLEGRRPRRRQVRPVLLAGDQQGRPAPGRRPPVAGVPLQRRGPEPLAEGLRPPGAAARHERRTARVDKAAAAKLPEVDGHARPSRPRTSSTKAKDVLGRELGQGRLRMTVRCRHRGRAAPAAAAAGGGGRRASGWLAALPLLVFVAVCLRAARARHAVRRVHRQGPGRPAPPRAPRRT